MAVSIPYRQHREFLVTYLRPQLPRVALLTVLLFTGIGLQLLTPQIVRRFIDAARAGAAVEALARLAFAYLAVAVAGQIISVLSVYSGENVGWTATNTLREALALHCLRLDLSFHNAKTPEEMIERVDGHVPQLSSFFSQFVIRVVGNAVLLVGILVLLYRADWHVGLAYAGFTIGALLILRWLIASAVPYWRDARQTSAVLLGFLEERLSGTEDIRSSGAVPYVMRRLYEVLRTQLEKSRPAWLRGTMLWATTSGLLALANALAFGMGAYLLHGGVITLGTVYLFFHYTEMLRRPLEQITRQMQELQRAGASIGRVGDLLVLQPTATDGPRSLPAGALEVQVDHLSFGYDEGDPVLEDISLRVAQGRVLGLLGRTGSGKTTLCRLMVRFYDPTAGAIRLGGADHRDLPLTELPKLLGLVTQDVQLFHASVRDNLTFFDRGIADARIMAVLVGRGGAAGGFTFSPGVGPPVGPHPVSAAGGALVAVARVVFKDAGRVLLFVVSSPLGPA